MQMCSAPIPLSNQQGTVDCSLKLIYSPDFPLNNVWLGMGLPAKGNNGGDCAGSVDSVLGVYVTDPSSEVSC